MKTWMIVMVVGLLVCVGCATHNLSTIESGKVMTRTSTASDTKMDADGNMGATSLTLPVGQVMQDAEGTWSQQVGNFAVISMPMPGGGNSYIISPKDTKIAKAKLINGETTVELTGLEANISTPMSVLVDGLKASLPALQGMTKEEALATVEKWKAAGTMLPTVADMLTQIINAIFPAAAVVAP